MSEKENKYNISIAQSNKKASKAVDTFKIRRSGNSSIVTVPNSVKKALHVEDGDHIQYVTVENENDESTVVVRKTKKDQSDNQNKINEDNFEELLDETLDELDKVLEALVEL